MLYQLIPLLEINCISYSRYGQSNNINKVSYILKYVC